MTTNTSAVPRSHFILSGMAMATKAGSAFVLFILLSHFLVPGDFGLFAYYYTLGTTLMLILDFGFSIKLVKDISRQPEALRALMYRATLLKLVLLGVSVLTIPLLPMVGLVGNGEQTVAALLVLAMLLFSFITHFALPFRAMGRYGWELAYYALAEGGGLAVTAAVILMSGDLLHVAAAFMLFRILSLTFAYAVFSRQFGFERSAGSIGADARLNFPYFLQFALGTLYLTLDTVLLKYFVSDQDIGVYQAGIRLALAVTLPVALANTVLLPKFARDFAGPTGHRPRVNSYFIRFAASGAIVGGILAAFGDQLAVILYGRDFLVLGELMAGFALVAALRYIGAVPGTLLSASGRQHLRVWALSISLAFLIAGDLYAMPRYGIAGAVWIQAAAHAILILCYLAFSAPLLLRRGQQDGREGSSS